MAYNVKFKSGTQEEYNALVTKDEAALYFIKDSQRLYKGDKLYAVGAEASHAFAGLLSPEDKIALDNLIDGNYDERISAIEEDIGEIKKFIENPVLYYGYYLNGHFYADSTYTEELPEEFGHIYVDCIVKGTMYTWNGESFDLCVPEASEDRAGIMKLYGDGGANTDGAMSQKAVTDGVQSIGFALDNEEEDCLIVDLPWDNIHGFYPE